jgi:NADH-quinone oxidoreductase subunit A
MSEMRAGLIWPLFVYGAAVFVIVAGIVGLSHVLGQRHREKETGEPYESGILVTGSARVRFSVHFYLVAMLFVIFDLEAVFIIAFAISFRESGWPGYLGLAFFLGVLLAVLAYEWRMGAFDFALRGRDVLRKCQDQGKRERSQACGERGA